MREGHKEMAEEPAKVDLATPDLAEIKRSGFDELFPGIISDGVLDADQLGELLDIAVAGPADGRERYGLQWAGKREAIRSLLTPSRGTLAPDLDNSVDFDNAVNVFIEGDNLEVLKLLQKAYNDRVDLIYIDPPYNTGNDFVYNDDFSDGLRSYLAFTGQLDEDGMRLSTDQETTGRKHSRWLSMMLPRLVLARNLLSQDGVIFISIDDNEVAQLRLLLDEVFGPENFIATFIWEKRQNRENRKEVSYRHDTIICYARSADEARRLHQLPMSAKALANYRNPDNDQRGPWKSDPATGQAGHGTAAQFYVVTAPNGKQHKLPSGRCWIYSQNVMQKAIEEGRMWFGADGNGVPRVKTYLEAKERGLVPETILFASDVGTNESAKNDLKKLFGGIAAFDTPKPVALLQTLAQIGASSDSLILDFFAGSGTMGEAVLRLNADDGGTRRVIQVQLPEVLPSDSEARRLKHDTVADVARDRWSRVAETMSSTVDTSLRSLRLHRSNFVRQDDADGQLVLTVSTLRNDADDVWSIASEVLLKEGVLLNAPWTEHKFGDVMVAMSGDVAVVIGADLDEVVVQGAFDLAPRVVVFLEDDLAGKDALKANAFTNARNLGITMKTV
jgi:adenine-specific DNA-methyltransferase